MGYTISRGALGEKEEVDEFGQEKDGRVQVSFGQARWLFVPAAPATADCTLTLSPLKIVSDSEY